VEIPLVWQELHVFKSVKILGIIREWASLILGCFLIDMQGHNLVPIGVVLAPLHVIRKRFSKAVYIWGESVISIFLGAIWVSEVTIVALVAKLSTVFVLAFAF
jgi:hypothetical protein